MTSSRNKDGSFLRWTPLYAIVCGVALPLAANLAAKIVSGQKAVVLLLVVGQIPFVMLALILKVQLSGWYDMDRRNKIIRGFRSVGAAIPVVLPSFFVHFGILTSSSGSSALAFVWLPIWQLLLLTLGYYGGSIFGEFISFLDRRAEGRKQSQQSS